VKVVAARCEGEMFRGIETILQGRDPLDAQQITQRICGVCPISHGMASLMAQEMAYGIEPVKNGRLAQNLILGANYLQSRVLHFYHLSALELNSQAGNLRTTVKEMVQLLENTHQEQVATEVPVTAPTKTKNRVTPRLAAAAHPAR
jgi:Ni,Fe-hydrogenase I large subunit